MERMETSLHVSKEGNKVERRAGVEFHFSPSVDLLAMPHCNIGGGTGESVGEVPKVSHEERGLTAVQQVKAKKGRKGIRMVARGGVGSAFGALRRYNDCNGFHFRGLDCVCIWTGHMELCNLFGLQMDECNEGIWPCPLSGPVIGGVGVRV